MRPLKRKNRTHPTALIRSAHVKNGYLRRQWKHSGTHSALHVVMSVVYSVYIG